MASKRAQRRRSCGNKVRHTCAQHAWAHIMVLHKQGHSGIRIYRCQFCGGYHVGHYARKDQGK